MTGELHDVGCPGPGDACRCRRVYRIEEAPANPPSGANRGGRILRYPGSARPPEELEEHDADS